MAQILSIEDDPDLQHLIGFTLHTHGYNAHYAFNGKEGYEKALSLKPDLILLDLMLPLMNGIELIKLLKANKETREIPILVITAYGDEANMLEHSVKLLGAVEYIKKPLEMRELLQLIKKNLLGQPRKEEPAPDIKKGVVRADPKFRSVWIEDRLVTSLSPKEFKLLKTLLEAEGEVKKEKLIRKIWNEPAHENTLEKAIQRLREALGPVDGKRIQTTSKGYELIG